MSRTKGAVMISGLRESLGLDDNCGPLRKKPRVVVVAEEEARPFDPDQDAFQMTTHMVKLMSQVTDCFKDNVIANLQFDPGGIHLFSLHHARTVCISTFLGRDLFSTFRCEREVCTTLNLVVLAKKIAILQKFRIQKLIFANKGDDLVLAGQRDAEAPAEIRLKSLTSEVEELDLSAFKFDVVFRLISADLAKLIDCMPPVFSIEVNIDQGGLVFSGHDDHSVTRLSLRLDKNILLEIARFENVKNYKSTFIKANLSAIGKGAKLSEFAQVGLSSDSPLFVRYVLNESSDLDAKKNSSISMYFSPKLDDDIDEEE